jgi:hypothetical protein
MRSVHSSTSLIVTRMEVPNRTMSDTAAPTTRSLAPTIRLDQAAGWLTCLYALILIPILRADRLYNDDLKRALFGRTGWDSNGRPLTTLVMKVLQCYDHTLVDISPFSQLIAGALLVWTGILVARRFCAASPFLTALLVFPLGAQPFFLENLSYKFDALSMALALLTALLPFSLTRSGRRSWWWGVLSLFACLNFYQPALNAFLIFLLLEAALGAAELVPVEAIARTLRFRLTQVLLSGLIYELLIGIHVNGWVKRKGAPIHSVSELPRLGENLRHFLDYIGSSFNHQWWAYFGPLLFVLGAASVWVLARYALRMRDAYPAWLVAALVVSGCFLPFAALVATFGPLLLLADPPIEPRVFIGVGPLLCAALILFHATLRASLISSNWALAAGAMVAVGCSVMASVYGNAAAQQKAFEEDIARTLADDVANVSARQPLQSLLLEGAAGYSRFTAHVVEEFPLIQRLIPTYLDASDQFHPHIFLVAYLGDFEDLRLQNTPAVMARNAELLDGICNEEPLAVRAAYRMYSKDHVGVVLFGPAYEKRCPNSKGASQTSNQGVSIRRE